MFDTNLSTDSLSIPDQINKSTSKTKFSCSRNSGSTDPDAVLKAEFEDKVAKRIQATENHEFLKWTDLKKICIEIRDMDTRFEFQERLVNRSVRTELSINHRRIFNPCIREKGQGLSWKPYSNWPKISSNLSQSPLERFRSDLLSKGIGWPGFVKLFPSPK